jgi:integrase
VIFDTNKTGEIAMPRKIPELTDKQVENAKPDPAKRITSLFDGKGLYLEIHPNGTKRWRMKCRFNGKDKLMTFGTYPAISLREARQRRDETRKQLDSGVDPIEAKRAVKAAQEAQEQAAQVILEEEADTFRKVAEGWREVWKTHVTPQTEKEIWANLENNVFPDLGGLPIAKVTTKVLLDCLRKIEATGRGAILRKAKAAASLIFKYAIQEERGGIKQNPVENFDRHTFKKFGVRNFPAIVEPAEVGKLLRAIDAYRGTLPSVSAALRLAPLLFQRIGELRTMKWADLDLAAGEWFYTVSKTQTPHHVPLARQAVAILEELRPQTEPLSEFVFPGFRLVRPISNAAINTALEAMGYDTQNEMTGHGFRAMAYTLLREKLKYPNEIVDVQLAHRHSEDRYDGAYARMTFKDERVGMMQAWGDYLDRLKIGADVIPLRA